MAVPVITVDCAFGDAPGAASFTWRTIHEDRNLETVRGMSYQRGRQNELNRMETGTGRLGIRDEVSDFDSDNPDSVYYPDVRPYLPLRARATIAGVTYPLLQHFVERLPRTRRVRDVYTERELTTVDGFEWLARAGIAGETYAQEPTGTRIANVLDDVGWSSGLRDLDAGNNTQPAATFAADDGSKALSHLLDVTEAENGLLFVDAQGRVAFVQRHSLIASPYTVSQVTFRDAVAGGGGFPFVDAQPSFDLDTTFNEFSGTRDGGTTQTASDGASQMAYGLRSQQLTPLATSDNDVLAQMQWKLAQFKEPLNRLESITVMPGEDTGFWQAVLGLEVGERVTVRELPPGFAAVKAAEYVIQSIQADFPPGPVSGARFTFGLWPADTTSGWLVLDDAAVGVLDTGKLAY